MKKKMVVVGKDDGIILELNRCVILDELELGEADQNLLNFGTETDAISVADRCGVPLHEILDGCGYGDLNYFNCISLSPVALREEFNELPAMLPDDLDNIEEVKKILAWGANLSTDQLMNLGAYTMQDDSLWTQWRTSVFASLATFYNEFVTKSDKP